MSVNLQIGFINLHLVSVNLQLLIYVNLHILPVKLHILSVNFKTVIIWVLNPFLVFGRLVNTSLKLRRRNGLINNPLVYLGLNYD